MAEGSSQGRGVPEVLPLGKAQPILWEWLGAASAISAAGSWCMEHCAKLNLPPFQVLLGHGRAMPVLQRSQMIHVWAAMGYGGEQDLLGICLVAAPPRADSSCEPSPEAGFGSRAFCQTQSCSRLCLPGLGQ